MNGKFQHLEHLQFVITVIGSFSTVYSINRTSYIKFLGIIKCLVTKIYVMNENSNVTIVS